jgi:tetratricopeptide (TPR) repeat protein
VGRLTPLLLATSAGLLLLAGAQRLLPAGGLRPGGAPAWSAPDVAPAAAPDAPGAAPFAAARPPAWSTTDAAVGRLQQRLQQQPEDAPAYAQLAALYLQQARETGDPTAYTRAEGALQQAARRAPDDPLVAVLGGTLQLARHDFAAAQRSGERAVALAPTNPAGYGVAGDAALELGQYDRAVAAFQTMVDLRPDLASYSRVAYARELHGDLPGATEAMQRAVSSGAPLAEGTNWARVQLGDLLLMQGDLDGADVQYGLALRALPDYVHALGGQGRAAAARGDLGRAIERTARAQALVPLPEFAVALGDYHRAGGDPAAAARQDELVRVIARLQQGSGMDVDLEMSVFEADRAGSGDAAALAGAVERARTAYARHPSVTAADALAWTLYRAGQPAAALPYAREALRLGSRDPQVLFHAGAIFLAGGAPDEARPLLRAATAAGPRLPVRYAPEARRLLDAAGGNE